MEPAGRRAPRAACNLSAFEAHRAFGFRRHELVQGAGAPRWREVPGSLGRLTQLSDLPTETELRRRVKLAAKLDEEGVRARRTRTGPRKPLETPPEPARALAEDARVRRSYEAFPPSRRREHDEWIAEAKRDETRARRVAQTREWLREGRPRRRKYR